MNHFVERKHRNGTESWMVHCHNILMARSGYTIRDSEKSCIRDSSQQNSVNKKQCELKNTVDSSTFKVNLKVLDNGIFLQLLCSKKKKARELRQKKRGLKNIWYRCSFRLIVPMLQFVQLLGHTLTIDGGTHYVLALNLSFSLFRRTTDNAYSFSTNTQTRH